MEFRRNGEIDDQTNNKDKPYVYYSFETSWSAFEYQFSYVKTKRFYP